MEPSKPHKINQGEEIDLLELLAKAILIIRKNLLLLITSFIIGSLLGLAYYQVSPNVYESRMFISSDILTESYSKSIIDNLVKLMREENATALSRKLGISEDQASNLVSVEVRSALDKSDGTLEAGKAYFYVVARSKDNAGWSQLEDALIKCLQSNEFVKVRVEQRKIFYKSLIEKIDSELVDLETLKKKILEGDASKSSKENLFMFDPTTINSKIVEMTKDRASYQNALETANSVQLVEGFIPFKKQASPKLSLSVAAGSSFGLFFAGLYIAIQLIRSMMRFSEEKLGKS